MGMIVRSAGLAAGVIALIALVGILSYRWEELAFVASIGTKKQAPADEADDKSAANGKENPHGSGTLIVDDDDDEALAAKPPAGPSGLSEQRWDVVQTTGEEGAAVAVKYRGERGWEIVGFREKGISLYGAPAFEVPVRKWDDIPLYPCSDCHNKREIDRTPRVLKEKHGDLVVQHANARLWCTDCHDGKGLDNLTSRRGKPIDMDQSHVHCGECHFKQLKDWEFGVHGRRIGLWSGERVLRACTECHDAHQPRIKPAQPKPPPRYRDNLSAFAPKPVQRPPVWERFSKGGSR
jgi:hypothetical protein